MVKFFLLCIFLVVGCASHPPTPPSMPSDKDFQVPANLADQFAVRDDGSGKAPPKMEPIPVAPPPPVKGKKGHKLSKKEAMKAKQDAALAVATKPAAPVNRWTMTPFFKPGEHITFDITYFGATAGQLELDVLPEKNVADRPTYHFRAVASSTSIFSLFYRVNDVAESFMDTTGLFSHKFSLKLDESKQTRDVLELYDQQKRKAYYWSKLETAAHGLQKEQSEIDLVPFTQDGLSSFFYVRTLPLEMG
ncbi:MAG: DUF3108 domain-containing protein, partial [Bdellovibrionota bacterium]